MIFRKCERLFFVMFFTGGGGGERVSVFSCFQKKIGSVKDCFCHVGNQGVKDFILCFVSSFETHVFTLRLF